jgi:hypothetical protein
MRSKPAIIARWVQHRLATFQSRCTAVQFCAFTPQFAGANCSSGASQLYPESLISYGLTALKSPKSISYQLQVYALIEYGFPRKAA